jgi:CubicO group peptidase (beta-lactamase class C family)
VRHLLTHTAGLAYGFWNADLARWDATAGSGDALAAPMTTDPGTRFEYGLATDWVGVVVAAVSGQPLEDYLAEHVLGPLGMTSTSFVVPDDRRDRCVPVHVRDVTGRWVATGIDWGPQAERRSGGHGLYSTPRDYLRFQRMLLGGGTLAGTTVLGRATVREAFTNQLGALGVPAVMRTTDPAWSCDVVAGPGTTWGWGLRLDAGEPALRAAGSGGWMGIFNTRFWVDPHAGVTGGVYTQCLPFCAPEALRVFADVEQAVYAVLSGRS